MFYIKIFVYYRSSLKRKRYNVLQDILIEYQRVVSNYTNRFQSYFPITCITFEVLTILGSNLKNNFDIGRPTTSKKQLLSMIWLLATPNSYRYVFERIKYTYKYVSIYS